MNTENKLIVNARNWIVLYHFHKAFIISASLLFLSIRYFEYIPTYAIIMFQVLNIFVVFAVVVLAYILFFRTKIELDTAEMNIKAPTVNQFRLKTFVFKIRDIKSIEIASIKYFHDNINNFNDVNLVKDINAYNNTSITHVISKKQRSLIYIQANSENGVHSYVIFEISTYLKKDIKKLIQKFRDLNINVVIEPILKLE